MHNDQISYNNDIEFFIYQTSGHLVDLGSKFSPLPATFTELLPRPPLKELISLPLKLFPPLPLPWLMDDCVVNALSNDVMFC